MRKVMARVMLGRFWSKRTDKATWLAYGRVMIDGRVEQRLVIFWKADGGYTVKVLETPLPARTYLAIPFYRRKS